MAETPWQMRRCVAPSFYAELFESASRVTLFVNATDVGFGPEFNRMNLPYGATLGQQPAHGEYRRLKGSSPVPHQLRGFPRAEALWAEFRDELIALLLKHMPHPCWLGPISCVAMLCLQHAKERAFKPVLSAFIDGWFARWGECGVHLSYFDKSGLYSARIITTGRMEATHGMFRCYGVTLVLGQTQVHAPVPVPVPDNMQRQRLQQFVVTIPPGVGPGMQFGVQIPDGRVVQVTAPPGQLPGSQVAIQA